MPSLAPNAPDLVGELTSSQAGVLSRRQALDAGLTQERINHLLDSGRWQRVLPGVYAVFTGPRTYLTRACAAVLYAGRGAALGMETAEYFWGLTDKPPSQIHVIVPADRRVTSQPGVRVHIRTALPSRIHPVRWPPMTCVEDTVLDLVERATAAQDVVGIVTRACQRRLTTAARLAACAARRKKMRWRSLLGDVLEDVRNGVLSALERWWRRDVEQAHGLPRGERNRREPGSTGNRYRDVRYRGLCMIVELDGRASHPDELRHRDMQRDNAALEEGDVTLRYGWFDVTSAPCEAAAQFIRVARQRGWKGTPRACGPSCRLEQSLRSV